MWKKLFFIPFFIISVIGTVVYANMLLTDPLTGIFSFQSGTLFTIIYLCIALSLTALFFSIIVMLSGNWAIPLFTAIFGALVPLMMIAETPLNMIMAGGFLLSFIIGMIYSLQKLKTYIHFSPSQLISPPVKLIILVLVLTLSYSYYSLAETELKAKGFSIPDPLIDAAIAMSGTNLSGEATSDTSTPQPSLPNINLTTEQITMLKQNPALLKQFGVTAKDLDAIIASQQKAGKTTSKGGAESTESPNLIKTMVKSQLDNALKPYETYIPPFLAVLFFTSVVSISSLTGFFLPIILWILFWIFEKSGFIKFTKELREVKKLDLS